MEAETELQTIKENMRSPAPLKRGPWLSRLPGRLLPKKTTKSKKGSTGPPIGKPAATRGRTPLSTLLGDRKKSRTTNTPNEIRRLKDDGKEETKSEEGADAPTGADAPAPMFPGLTTEEAEFEGDDTFQYPVGLPDDTNVRSCYRAYYNAKWPGAQKFIKEMTDEMWSEFEEKQKPRHKREARPAVEAIVAKYLEAPEDDPRLKAYVEREVQPAAEALEVAFAEYTVRLNEKLKEIFIDI